MKRFALHAFLAILGFCAAAMLAGGNASAAVLYTFEAPQFVAGQTTPLLNIAPNSGGGGFTTSFTVGGDPTSYQVTTITENSLMVGQSLFAPTTTAALHLAFSTSVTSLSVNFAINDPNGNPAGSLVLTTPVGGTTQVSSNVGGTFQGGHLTFTSATGFTSADLQGFGPGGATQMAIDNLSLEPATSSPVPAPATIVLALTAAPVGLLGWARRRRVAA
jgi:hypothetical protein